MLGKYHVVYTCIEILLLITNTWERSSPQLWHSTIDRRGWSATAVISLAEIQESPQWNFFFNDRSENFFRRQFLDRALTRVNHFASRQTCRLDPANSQTVLSSAEETCSHFLVAHVRSFSILEMCLCKAS